MVADGGETRPHPHAVGVTPGLFSGLLHGAHTTRHRLRCEVGVQDDIVEQPTTKPQGIGTERHQSQPDVLVEVRVEHQDLILPDRTVMVEDDLAAPQSTHYLREVFHLGGGHRGNAVRRVDRPDTAADTQGEATAGESVHGGGPRSTNQRVTGVVIGCGRGDLHPGGHRACRTGQRGRLLDIPALGDERGAESQFLASAGLSHQGRRTLTTGAGQQVVAQFIKCAHRLPQIR